jgi:hypothetical protein
MRAYKLPESLEAPSGGGRYLPARLWHFAWRSAGAGSRGHPYASEIANDNEY